MADDIDDEHALRRARRILESVTARARTSCAASGARGDAARVCPVNQAVVARRGVSREEYERAGRALVRDGRVAIVLLAGGQGTRLGSDAPKGCYDIGLPSRKSLFQLQCERVLSLQRLSGAALPLPLYVMTSEFTHAHTVDFFTMHRNFGLDESQVVFFKQQAMPCLTEAGEPIFFVIGERGERQMARAPDGNGGVYEALARNGCIDDMERRGITCVDCFCVDNALVLPAEPTWIGYDLDEYTVLTRPNTSSSAEWNPERIFDSREAANRRAELTTMMTMTVTTNGRTPAPRQLHHRYCHSVGADCGAKVALKRDGGEKVGVFVKRQADAGSKGDCGEADGCGISVMEYSEMGAADAEARGDDGELVFKWANLCMQYFSLAFLRRAASILESKGSYHVARKRISGPGADGVDVSVNGIKLEAFIFDVFPYASTLALFEVERDDEFAPVKNAPGSAIDSPDTARAMVLGLHRRWREMAGASARDVEIVGVDTPLEISPLVSYAGENICANAA